LLAGACPRSPQQASISFLTDPPYITRYKSRDGRSVANDDNDRWLKPAFAQMHRVLKNEQLCRELLRLAAGGQVHGSLPQRGFRIVGHFVFPKPLHVLHSLRALSA